MNAAGRIVDLLLPPRCPACDAPAVMTWCGPCLGALSGLVLPDHGDVALDDGVRAVGAYAYDGVVRDTVLAVKVRGRHAALPAMGRLMRARLGLDHAGVGRADPQRPRVAGPGRPWVLTWVPATRRRVRRRGVDPPRVLAGPGAVRLLRRVRDAPDQTALAADERRRAPLGGFVADGWVPPAVVLVDDVRTTGTTARAAAAALREAGARRVLVVTFAVSGRDARAGAAPATRAASAAPPALPTFAPRGRGDQPGPDADAARPGRR